MKLRSQVGQTTRRASLEAQLDSTAAGRSVAIGSDRLPFVPSPASPMIQRGSSGQLDCAINAYVEGNRTLVIVQPDATTKSGVRLRRQPAEYVSFLKRADISDDLYRMLRESRATIRLSIEGDWLRICWRDFAVCRDYNVALRAQSISTYDGGIDPVTRWMADTGAVVSSPRLGYLDFETDSRIAISRMREMRILSQALVTRDYEWAITLEEDTDVAERRLLIALWERIDRLDQIASWNGDEFDFPLLQARTLRHGIAIPWKRWLWLDHMRLFESMNKMAAESGDEKQSMSLSAISQAVLGEGKLDLDASRSWDYWNEGGESREKLRIYNLRDSQLMSRIEAKTGYIALLGSLAATCGSFPDSRGMLPTVQIENLLQRLAVQRGYKFETFDSKTKPRTNSSASFRGAYVMEPTIRGIVKNVHVCDFSSLYPSIIRTWNMSTETKCPIRFSPVTFIDDIVRRNAKSQFWGDGDCVTPITGVMFKLNPEGMLAGAVAEMMRLRKEWNDKKTNSTPGTAEWVDADRRSTACKIAANSCYGAIGMPTFRHHDVDVAESVSQAGVWLVKQTIKAAEERGLQILYSDTDSVFVYGCTRDEFTSFVNWCNIELYPRLLKPLGCQPGLIKLAYEKAFERVVMIQKKRYCGRYSHYKGTAATVDSKPEVKGLEYKRGDSIRLARRMQEEIVDWLVGQGRGIEDPAAYQGLLDEWRYRVSTAKLELSDIVITKSLGKPLKEYAQKIKKDGTAGKQPPHVEIAKILAARGQHITEGTRISYVIVDGSKSSRSTVPAEDWTGDVNRKVLWETLVAPPSLRVLEAAFPEIEWASFGKGLDTTQSDLFDRRS